MKKKSQLKGGASWRSGNPAHSQRAAAKPKPTPPTLTLYLGLPLKAELQKRADANFRSLTAEAALIIKTAMEGK